MACVLCYAGIPHLLSEGCDGFELDLELGPTEPVVELPIIPEFVGSIDVPAEKRPVGRPAKDGEDMDNVLATGRKRAAKAAPLEAGMVCEWARLEKAGGGIKPIAGCVGFPATDRHHGPDKSVLNNETGVNLHRICSRCHNRWHAENNQFYTEPRPEGGLPWLPDPKYGECIPHDPVTKMSMATALQVEELRQQDDRRGL